MSDSSNQSDHNPGGLIAFIFSMVASLIFFVYVSFFMGVDLKEVKEQAAAGTTMADTGAEAAKKVDVSNVEKPWLTSEDLVTHGQAVYKTNCEVCHGPTGKGDGVAGKALVPPPRNLVEGKWTVGGDRIALYKTLANGIEGTSMVGFSQLSAVDRWAMVHYIRSITENLVKDDDAKVEKFAAEAK